MSAKNTSLPKLYPERHPPRAHYGCIRPEHHLFNNQVDDRWQGHKGYITVASAFCTPPLQLEKYLRPKNSASDVNVPCSASKRSSNGTSARMFITAWNKLRCINGNVFIRYTACYCQPAPFSLSAFLLFLPLPAIVVPPSPIPSRPVVPVAIPSKPPDNKK